MRILIVDLWKIIWQSVGWSEWVGKKEVID